MFGFSDCGLCNGTGLVENLATGARESCWRCVERAAGVGELAEPLAPMRPATVANKNQQEPVPRSSAELWSPERGAFVLKTGLWLALGLAGAALVRFAEPKKESDSDVPSDLETSEPDSAGVGTADDYSPWEPQS